MYRLPSETLLRRVSYHGTLPFACPLAIDARGLRTMLKRSREWAAIDVENDRFVCAAWPGCRHRDADECTRMTRRLPRWRADED